MTYQIHRVCSHALPKYLLYFECCVFTPAPVEYDLFSCSLLRSVTFGIIIKAYVAGKQFCTYSSIRHRDLESPALQPKLKKTFTAAKVTRGCIQGSTSKTTRLLRGLGHNRASQTVTDCNAVVLPILQRWSNYSSPGSKTVNMFVSLKITFLSQ